MTGPDCACGCGAYDHVWLNGLYCRRCRTRCEEVDAPHPCDCDDCRAAVEHLADLEIDRMRQEGS